jgi:hypothetical protein
MYTEITMHDSYIILISGPCEERKEYISRFQQQLYKLSADNNTWQSWNPRATFLVSVMSNCGRKENTDISRAILSELWFREVMKATVLFLESNENEISDMEGNTTESVYGTYLEMHSWIPYENSHRCHPTEGTVRVNTFTARNFSDIKKIEIFRKNYKKDFQKCHITVHVRTEPPFVNEPKLIWNKESGFQNVYESGWEIELLGVVGNTLIISLDFQVGNIREYFKDSPTIYVGGYASLPSVKFDFKEPTRNYLTLRLVWYTPCSQKYPRWRRFFKIFSAQVWVSFAFSFVLAVVTARCISKYTQNSHPHESKSYNDISSVAVNIFAVLVSVSTQPRSSPLRLFFFCWLCFSVAISTVFQAYLTTFLIEPGYVEPIKSVEQMLSYEKEFGFVDWNIHFFSDSSEPLNTEILKSSIRCPNSDTCFKWAAVYQNFSTILDDISVEIFRANGKLSDENNLPLLCVLENGVVRTHGFVFFVRKGTYFLEHINGIIDRVVEAGIFTHIQKQYFYKQKLDSQFNSPTFADTYTAISISHLQTVFYLLLFGYVLAVAFFVAEIMWHRCRSKRSEPNSTSLFQYVH